MCVSVLGEFSSGVYICPNKGPVRFGDRLLIRGGLPQGSANPVNTKAL